MPKKPTFLTVADDVMPAAYAAHDYLVGLGYRVKVEKADVRMPTGPRSNLPSIGTMTDQDLLCPTRTGKPA